MARSVQFSSLITAKNDAWKTSQSAIEHSKDPVGMTKFTDKDYRAMLQVARATGLPFSTHLKMFAINHPVVLGISALAATVGIGAAIFHFTKED